MTYSDLGVIFYVGEIENSFRTSWFYQLCRVSILCRNAYFRRCDKRNA